MHRSAKYLIQPTKGQARRLDHLLWMQRDLYNDALQERKSAWENEGQSLSRFDQFNGLKGIADDKPELGQYGICVARGTLTRLDLAYKAFYRRCQAGQTPGHPRFKGRGRWDSVCYAYAESGWRVKPATNRLYLKGVGDVKLNLHRPLPGRPRRAVVKREGRRWWAIIDCDQVEQRPLAPTGRRVGIDMGVASILTTSDGEHLANPRLTERAAERLATALRDRERKTMHSNRRRRAAKRVSAQQRKVANRRRDFAHQASRLLVDRCDLIAHEALTIRNLVRTPTPRSDGEGGWEPNGATAKAGMNRSIHDAGWGQLLRFIAYKAEEAGREVIAVAPHYTSQTCSACGHCEAGNRLTQAKFLCLSCGYTAHADENAAVNILRAGLALRRNKREVREVVGS